ncbi:TerC family protein [Enterovirga rhinocerotis]|uniref:Putative tellurium resistance membrane protein TerC n=1 Tax=Enterovirga rhinocerotis TaxID=1339210 RepID=A0A4R7C6S1_9HYPH|nr:TerC family protein [Enterovirga rhinocerotis]TDR94300.1 putative tellurium resistance membrane protein TerC [Enterovirga rhinocerotis]
MDSLITLFSQPEAWMALATLIIMEVVLGIDNLIFLSIISNKLPPERRATARYIGLGLALIMRLGLLFTITIIIGLTQPVITILEKGFSWRDIILIAGGLFLVYKATTEIHESVTPHEAEKTGSPLKPASFASVIAQIIVIDLVFSLDSIITAVGMTEHLPIMVISVIFAIVVMLIAANPLADFIKANPSIVMLALSFLLMIGMILIADGFGFHVPKGYVYAAMAFSILVESLNMLARRRRQHPREADEPEAPITQRAREQEQANQG